jgi:hypothetical protein
MKCDLCDNEMQVCPPYMRRDGHDSYYVLCNGHHKHSLLIIIEDDVIIQYSFADAKYTPEEWQRLLALKAFL